MSTGLKPRQLKGGTSLSRVLLALVTLLSLLSGCASRPMSRVPRPTATERASVASPEAGPTLGASPGPLPLWYLTRGGPKADLAMAVDVDNQSCVYLGAHQQAAGQLFTDMVIHKFSPEGAELWQTRWGGNYQEKAFVITVSPPMVYVGGLKHRGIGLDDADMAILALDMQDGHLVWEFTWGQSYGYQEVDGLLVDGDHIYASGWTTGEETSNDIAILKLEKKTGLLVWVKTWGGSGYDTANGQMVLDQESIFVCGRIDGLNYALGGHAYVAKFSKMTGEYVVHKTWSGKLMEDAYGMTSDGTFLYLVGITLSHGNGGQVFVLKYDKRLNLIWEQIWGGKKGESSRAIAVDEEGRILVAGHTDSFGAGGNDVMLLQYSPEGKLNWSNTWGGPANDTVGGLALRGGLAYMAGETFSLAAGANDALLLLADARTGQFPAFKAP